MSLFCVDDDSCSVEVGIQCRYDQLEQYEKILTTFDVGIEVTDFAYPQNYGLEGETILDNWLNSPYHSRIQGLYGSFYDLILHSLDPQITEITRKRYLWNLGTADQLNSEYCLFHSNYQVNRHNERYMKRWLHDHRKFIQQYDDQYSTKIVFKQAQENFFNHFQLLLKYSNDHHSSFCLDIASLGSNAGDRTSQWFEILTDTIRVIHLSDTDGTNTELPLGDGLLDWQVLLPQVIDYNPNYIILEMEGSKAIVQSLELLENYQR